MFSRSMAGNRDNRLMQGVKLTPDVQVVVLLRFAGNVRGFTGIPA